MKTLITMLGVVAALAIPAAALSHDGQGKDDGKRLRDRAEHSGLVAVGTGSLTAGTFKGRPIATGSYTTSIQTTGPATTTPTTTTVKTTTTTHGTTTHGTTTRATTTAHTTTTSTIPRHASKNCMPATGTITLTATAGAAAAITETVQGRLCTKTTAEHGTKVAFFGRFAVTSATGGASAFHDHKGLVAIVQIRDTTNFRFVELGGRKAHDDNDRRHDDDHD
jgi:hypothetical protein